MRAKQPSREEICREYADWASELREFVHLTEGDMRIYAFYMLPVGMKWETRQGVTLMGDAAHLMTPFAGEGVNIALEDAMKLAEAIISTKDQDIDCQLESVAAYERQMFDRAVNAQALTKKLMDLMFFTEGAPRTSIQHWVATRAVYDCNPAIKPLVYPFIAAGIFSFYSVFKLLV